MRREPLRFPRSKALFKRALKTIAGGVNSSVRSGQKPHPLFYQSGEGARVRDADGNRLIDFVMGNGPLILGHRPKEVIEALQRQLSRGILFSGQTEIEVEAAEAVCELVPCAERVRFTQTGTEAVLAALRLARAATGRPRVLKFRGHYHGWSDPVLFNHAGGPTDPAADGLYPLHADSRGSAAHAGDDLLVTRWNDAALLERVLDAHRGEIAAVIMEPVMGNPGVVVPSPGYLERVRALCTRAGAVLIFDEVITGFRLAAGGAQERFGVTPDLAVFSKALAGGFPVSCVAGKAALFQGVVDGNVVLAGTFNAGPLGMAAVRAVLTALKKKRKKVYGTLETLGTRLLEGFGALAQKSRLRPQVAGLPGLMRLWFPTDGASRSDPVNNDWGLHGGFLELLVHYGIRPHPGGGFFLSAAHTRADVDEAIEVCGAALEHLETLV